MSRGDRLPIESSQPVVLFAAVRLVIVVAALAALAVTGFGFDRLTDVMLGVALPWAFVMLLLARAKPSAALSPLVAVGDLVVLVLVEVVAPDAYGAVRVMAVFLIGAHAQFLGERLAAILAVCWVAVLIAVAAWRPGPVEGELLVLYETVFALAGLAAAVVISRLRAAETVGRLRARESTRRHIESEARIRRQLATSLHDGPVQELTSLDLMLAGAEQAAARGDTERAAHAVHEAREIAERNVRALRDEMVSLGPIAFDELSLDQAIENCSAVWRRRWKLDVKLELQQLDLPNDICGGLFGIAQEAVSNVGRHAEAERVDVKLARVDGVVTLEVRDDGKGFQPGESPLGASEPGHIGLQSMRERAEWLGGQLAIRTGEEGTTVRVSVPVAA